VAADFDAHATARSAGTARRRTVGRPGCDRAQRRRRETRFRLVRSASAEQPS
jgi:hypothetical protein